MEVKKENERLRKALEEIINYDCCDYYEEVKKIAMEALYLKRTALQEISCLFDKMLSDFETDHTDDAGKQALVPQNNREYWIFTETHQMLKNFQKEINKLKAEKSSEPN